jgi:hypothetical protein
VVVVSGLYILWRETLRRRRPRQAAAPPVMPVDPEPLNTDPAM